MALAIAAVGALQDTLKDTFLTWPPAVSFARRTALSMFSGLETGSLLIIDETMGVEHIFDQKITIANGKDVRSIYTIPEVRIVVKRDSFWLRLILFADIGFAEGYMLGDLECNDLTSFFRVCAIFFQLSEKSSLKEYYLDLYHEQKEIKRWDDFLFRYFIDDIKTGETHQYSCPLAPQCGCSLRYQ